MKGRRLGPQSFLLLTHLGWARQMLGRICYPTDSGNEKWTQKYYKWLFTFFLNKLKVSIWWIITIIIFIINNNNNNNNNNRIND